MKRFVSLLSALALALAFGTCADAPAPTGAAAISVRGAALSVADVDRVEVTITGTGIATPIVETLSGDASVGWSALLSDVPAGIDRTFTGRAYDSDDTLLYEGAASPVVILPGDTALVTIFMQQVDAPTPFSNTAPRITGLTVSAYDVDPGGTITLSVTAEDPDPGDTLTYAWTCPSGTFATPGAASTTWTAGAAAGSVVIHIGASDDSGATATLEIAVTVNGSGAASAYVGVDLNAAPIITSVVPSPTQIDVDDYTYLDLTASDPDGDTLTYEWDVTWPCEGYFDDPAIEDATFTLTAVETEWDDCELTVTITDGRGGQNSATLAVATGPDVCDGAICGPPVQVPGELLWLDTRSHLDNAVVADMTYDPANDWLVVAGTNHDLDETYLFADLFTSTGSFIDTVYPSDTVQGKGFAVACSADGVGYTGGWTEDNGSNAILRQHTGYWLDEGWEYTFHGLGVYDVLVDGSGNVYGLGIAGDSADRAFRLSRLPPEGPSGTVLNRDANPGLALLEGGGLAFDGAGNVVACGTVTDGSDDDLWLAKYDADTLDEVYSLTWGSPTAPTRNEQCEAISVDGLGNIYVVGSAISASDSDMWLGKFDALGAFVGEVLVDGNTHDQGLAVTTASNGIVYVGGVASTARLHAYRPTLVPYWTVSEPVLHVSGIVIRPSDGALFFGGGEDNVDAQDTFVARAVP